MKQLKVWSMAAAMTLVPTLSRAQSTTPSPFPSHFLDRLFTELGDQWDNAGAQLSTSLFEAITDQDIVDFDLFGGELSLKVNRKVYNNHDILDTWTVIDTFRVPYGITLPIVGTRELSGGFAELNVGVTLGLEAINIRQVRPTEVPLLESTRALSERIDNAEENANEDSVPYSELPAIFIKEDETQDSRINLLGSNPRTRARYSHLWNLLTHPLRLPLSANRVDKMVKGEIASYSLDGTIQLGATVGWSSVDITGFEGIDLGAGVSTYINGKFRISVLKNTDTQTRVKLTRVRNKGVSGTIAHSEAKAEIFEGFMLFDNRVARIRETLIPFSLLLNRNIAKQFDVGYDYDLSNEQARKAYDQAVFGRLSLSEELAQQKESGVTHAFTRNQREISHTRNYQLKLSLLFQKGHSTQKKHASAVITIDGKDHHIFKSVSSNIRAFDTLWGSSEARRYRFITTIDRDAFNRGEGGFALRIEGEIEDSRSRGDELIGYMNEVEAATGQWGLFQRPPQFDPVPDIVTQTGPRGQVTKKEVHRPMRYGRSSFFYRLGLTREQTEKFANISENRMWEILETGFGIKAGRWSGPLKRWSYFLSRSPVSLANIPLTLADVHFEAGGNLLLAKRFKKSWSELKDIRDPEELSKEIAKLFHSVNYGPEFIMVLREALKGEKIAYFISAKNDNLFGQLVKHGDASGDENPVLVRADEIIEFDRIGSRVTYDVDSSIEKFSAEVLDKDTVKIHYVLKSRPKYIYARVDKTENFARHKNLVKMAIKVEGPEFDIGAHDLIIKRGETEGLAGQLSKAIFSVRYATVMMAAAKEDRAWGAVQSARLKIEEEDDE
jgi:hypothetical protein